METVFQKDALALQKKMLYLNRYIHTANELTMKKVCLDCGQALIGRADKKFCDDACRSHYNNRNAREEIATLRKVNNILKRNRRILEKLNPNGKIKVKQIHMLNEGFQFDYMTSIYETAKGDQYRFCYEYGYLILENGDVLLVRRTDS